MIETPDRQWIFCRWLVCLVIHKTNIFVYTDDDLIVVKNIYTEKTAISGIILMSVYKNNQFVINVC
jgi:hypothetical protein